MVEREDIDALLIGALYGELTPADEARLAAHLESHPTDRTALDDLTRARAAVRESRILQTQLEPAPSISAVLIQEAARRAPKPAQTEGWFARFLASFMAHPAMAAAAMLVVVVGVATLITKRQGEHFADPSEPASVATRAGDRAPAAPSSVAPVQAPGADSADRAETSTEQYRVGLAEGDEPEEAPREEAPREQATLEAKPTDNENVQRRALAKGAKKESGIELRRPAPAPKDLDAPRAKAKAPSSAGRAMGGAAGGAPASTSSKNAETARGATRSAEFASPPPPAAPNQSAPAPGAPARDKAAAVDDEIAGDPLIAWASQQHRAAVAQARAGNCTNAGQISAAISTRAPSYFEQNVATDRALKECAPYIAAARQKVEQERAKRARASDVKRADEPSKRAADQPAAATPAK